MAAAEGWYDDGTGRQRWWNGAAWTDRYQDELAVDAPAPAASGFGATIERIQAEAVVGAQPRSALPGMSYVVLQVVSKEKLWGAGSGNLTELEKGINAQAARGYRLHTITTAASGTKGLGGGDRIQATMVFEKLV